MSTGWKQQTRLNDVAESADSDDSRAGGEPTLTDVDDQRQCRNCGAAVSPDWIRVFGRDGEAWGCPNCRTQREIQAGVVADPDRDVAFAYEGRY